MLAALIAVLPVNVLAGTASGSASTGNGGQDCEDIKKRPRYYWRNDRQRGKG